MSRWLSVVSRTAALSLTLLFATVGHGADRVVRGEDLTLARGETNRLYVTLESLGDENLVRFSVCYDTNLLVLVDALAGAAVSNTVPAPSFETNIISAESDGRVGITITLDATSAQTWSAGSNSIAE